MTQENKKNNLGDSDRSWHEKVKDVRTAMAKKRRKPDTEHSHQIPQSVSVAEIPSDSELFTEPVCEELTAQQIFSGGEAFYKSLEDTHPDVCPRLPDTEQIVLTQNNHFSFVRKVLAAAIFLVAAMVLYALLKSPSTYIADAPSEIKTQTPAGETAHLTLQQIQKPEPVIDSAQPLSLKVAQAFYINGDYKKAFDVYEKLHKNLPANPKEGLMRDFLQLQKVLCMEKTADYNQADYLLMEILNSDYPVVRTMAYYHCSLLEMRKKEYLNARTKAYQAIALIDTIDFDKSWCDSLKQNCYFLAAQAITREVLYLGDADKDLPVDLWNNIAEADELFTKLDESQLRTFMNCGLQKLNTAVLGPQIERFEQQGGSVRYDVTCNGAPLEELLARFIANADLDLRWNLNSNEGGIRRQLVYLHLSSAKTQQFITVSAGCSGLLARMDEKGAVSIFNPAAYSYISEHISLLGEEAIFLWQEFLLRFSEDKRLANAHFALGLLYASKGRLTESIGEYKLIANRFLSSSLAPYALLNSGKLKNHLHDYVGGHEDLKQLVQQFPDTEIAAKAYLYYADTTAKANLLTEAVKLYARVYNFNLSPESQIAAALGAGKCSYDAGDYKTAAKWLSQYINIAGNNQSEELYSVYLLLGKTYLALGNTEAAYSAFQYVFQVMPSRAAKEEYTKAIPTMIDVYIQQGQFVQALDLLESIYQLTLSQKESVEILLLKSRVLRAMGLSDKAIVILGDKAEFISDPQLKAETYFQLCECYIEKGDLNLAYRKLTEILMLAKSRPLMHEAALRLSDVCLKLGQSSQTISVCLQLLDLQPPEQTKQKALELLAMAYNQNKDYDKAALALLGQWK